MPRSIFLSSSTEMRAFAATVEADGVGSRLFRCSFSALPRALPCRFALAGRRVLAMHNSLPVIYSSPDLRKETLGSSCYSVARQVEAGVSGRQRALRLAKFHQPADAREARGPTLRAAGPAAGKRSGNDLTRRTRHM